MFFVYIYNLYIFIYTYLVFIYFFRVVVNVLYVFDFLYVSSEWLTDIFRKGPQGSELLFSNWSLDSAMQHTTPR